MKCLPVAVAECVCFAKSAGGASSFGWRVRGACRGDIRGCGKETYR